MIRRRPLLLALLLLSALAFRLLVVTTFHRSAGDGVQYHELAQELLRAGRFAFGPPPRPLTDTRLPGYPLFLAYAAVRAAPVPIETTLVRATRANVLLDGGS